MGIMQGPPDKIELMLVIFSDIFLSLICIYSHFFFDRKYWLRTKGSPQSRIDRCDFTQEKWITEPEFEFFEITR